MRKRIPLLPVLVAALLTISASTTQAAPFTLTLTDMTSGSVVSLEIGDNVLGLDLNSVGDRITYFGTVGSFDVTVSARTFLPGPSGAPVQMTLTNIQVTSTSAGQFTATLSRESLSPSLLGLGSAVIGIGTNGATLSAPGSVSFQNSIAGITAVSTTSTGGSLSSTSSPILVGGDFALLSRLDFNFAGGGTMTASSDFQVYSAPNPISTSEPTTFLLFGVGLLGLVGLSRRRSAAL